MNFVLLAQVRRLSPIQESVKHHFEEGGSVRTALYVLAALVGVVLVTGLISWIQRPLAAQRRGNPRKLFQRLLQQLPLSNRQRRFLWRMARDLHLPNPTLLLLSPGYFATCIDQWQARSTRRFPNGRNVDAVALERIRVAVFPKVGPAPSRTTPHHLSHGSRRTAQSAPGHAAHQRRD